MNAKMSIFFLLSPYSQGKIFLILPIVPSLHWELPPPLARNPDTTSISFRLSNNLHIYAQCLQMDTNITYG